MGALYLTMAPKIGVVDPIMIPTIRIKNRANKNNRSDGMELGLKYSKSEVIGNKSNTICSKADNNENGFQFGGRTGRMYTLNNAWGIERKKSPMVLNFPIEMPLFAPLEWSKSRNCCCFAPNTSINWCWKKITATTIPMLTIENCKRNCSFCVVRFEMNQKNRLGNKDNRI